MHVKIFRMENHVNVTFSEIRVIFMVYKASLIFYIKVNWFSSHAIFNLGLAAVIFYSYM